jgi:hypothetical protein
MSSGAGGRELRPKLKSTEAPENVLAGVVRLWREWKASPLLVAFVVDERPGSDHGSYVDGAEVSNSFCPFKARIFSFLQ